MKFSKITALFAVLALSVTTAFAQLDIDVDINKNEWYENPYIWVGVAVFLLILALIARGKK